ncbi:NlpC/P60 family protein [uncultured Sulfitobacter sp.]|uniref:C40 family peptidase n=1 Tax=uncultured Sulfitobacter sp. TaxID=191468 RepID=UPI0026347CA5|nr:NlpC/P60 family protein [uncultured Sulfitobacter sp.]
MNDPRLSPDTDLITLREAAQITRPLVNLMRRPGGPRDRQLLLGADVTVLDRRNGWAYVQAVLDGYCGFVETHQTAPPLRLTHKITSPGSHAYLKADIKSPDLVELSHGCRVAAMGETEQFIETAMGFIPKQHVAPVNVLADDPAHIAALFIGTPYLWGGNSRAGIDCSGLVQAACIACGVACPGDSDMQQRTLGTAVPDGTAPARNDLLFWKGHVGIVWEARTLLHANAHAMACVFEPLDAAIKRIAEADGPVTGHRRLTVA